MRYAIVLNGIVDNVVIWNGEGIVPGLTGSEAVLLSADQDCSIGWTYDGSTFAEPEE